MPYEPMQTIYIPYGDFLDLELHLLETRPGVKAKELVVELVKRWLATDKERLALLKDGPSMRGYQWKKVFLPDGTHLRTSHRQANEFAEVAGDRIISSTGEPLTPSQFANRHAKGRNAWRFIWLRFPGEEHWVRAFDYRERCNERSKPV